MNQLPISMLWRNGVMGTHTMRRFAAPGICFGGESFFCRKNGLGSRARREVRKGTGILSVFSFLFGKVLVSQIEAFS